MKRWKLVVIATLMVGSTACQTTTTDNESLQQLSGDPCSVATPTWLSWDGSQPPANKPTEIYIMTVPTNGYSLVALVDYQAATITYARKVATGKRNTFIAMTQQNYGRIVVGGGPPPPPDVSDPSILGKHLVFEAQLYAGVPYEARAAAQACPVQSPIGGGPIKGF